MSAAVRIPVVKGTPEWLEARRTGVTSTDIPAILGLDPWGTSEGDIGREKITGERKDHDAATLRRFRLGTLLEDAVRSEDEIEHGIALRSVNQLLRHPNILIALTSLDFRRVGERTIVEAKTTASRSRFADGLPEDIEAQCRWQMGVSGYHRCHVAVLRAGQDLECFDLDHDEATFAGLVTIVEDFWSRVEAGGPFAETNDSLKRRWPRDSGAEMAADAEITAWVRNLAVVRGQLRDLDAAKEGLEAALKGRMGEIATVRGDGFRITWKRTKDGEAVDYRALAESLLAPMPEPDRAAVVGPFVTARPGFRPFRVTLDKEDAS